MRHLNKMKYRVPAISPSEGSTTSPYLSPMSPIDSPMSVDRGSNGSGGVSPLAEQMQKVELNPPDPGLASYQKAFDTLIQNMSQAIVRRGRGNNSAYVKSAIQNDEASAESGNFGGPLSGASSTFRQIIPQNGSGTYSILYGN